MATLIDMPKLSDTMTVGTLVRWLKNEGDPVTNGDMIAEVETDKATMEVECFDEGILIKRYCGEGDEIAVGDPIAAIGEAGEEAPAVTSSAPAAAAPEPVAVVEAPAAPAPAPVAAPAAPAPVAAPAASTGARIKASPLAKKIAAEKGIDLATVQGSGPGGRILKEDVLKAKPVAASPAASAPAAAPAATLEALEIPVSNMRKASARRWSLPRHRHHISTYRSKSMARHLPSSAPSSMASLQTYRPNKVALNSPSMISPSRQQPKRCAASLRSIAHGKVTPSSNTPTCTSHLASQSMTASSLQ
jgi:pyruvate/2-oxoglutarate dehydrogenase complex dihydrolipoamide acyltransferase (E2) component